MPLARPRDSGGKRSAKMEPHIGLEQERAPSDGEEGVSPADCLPGCYQHSAEDEVPIGCGEAHTKEGC